MELDNFKSYAGKQIVGPFDDFTCIIGPNGAGKSNMMDAISFVLGVQSRHLRSSHLKELIFKKDEESGSSRKASVKLVYQVGDNEVSGYRGGQEIEFSRFVSSSGVSNYKLNDKDVTYEEYESLLQSIGVLVKARNFLVFQGDVESVASKTPAEITKLLEHICGSDLLRAEYEELMREKAEAEEKTVFSMQKRKMFATQKKEVKDQKEEAEEFQMKREELHQMKTEHVLMRILGLKLSIEEHQKSVDRYGSAYTTAKEKEVNSEAEVVEVKKQIARLSKQCTAAEKDKAYNEKQKAALNLRLLETREKLLRLNERVGVLETSESKVQKDLEEQSVNITSLREELESLSATEVELRAQQDSTESSVQLNQDELDEYRNLREELAARIATESAEILAIEQNASSKRVNIQRIESQQDAIRTDLDGAQQLIDEYSSRISKLDDSITQSETEKAEMLEEREIMNENIRSCQQKAVTLNAELAEVMVKLNEVGEDRKRGKQEEKMNDAIETMKRIFTGVHGKLIDLCRPIQKKYSTAVTVAGGKHMDAIVVDSKQTASDCIRYMKDQRIGTCSILPLDNIVPKPVPERLRALSDGFRICQDLVECDDMFKPAISYALGSTVVCDSLEQAQDLCFNHNERVKVVTLTGHQIGKSGAMTGGTSGQSKDRWEEKEVEKIRKKKNEIEENIAENRRAMPSRQQLVDLDTKLKTLQTKIQFSQADRKVTRERLNQVHQQVVLKNKTSESLKSEANSLQTELLGLDSKMQEVRDVIRNVELEVFGEFSRKQGVANIREYEDSKLKTHQVLMEKFSDILEQKASLAAQLEYEQKRDFKGSLIRLASQIKEAKAEVVDLQEEESELKEKEVQIESASVDTEKKLKYATDELETETKRSKLLHQKRTTTIADRENLSKKVSTENILIERCRAQIHDVLQRAEVDEIYLPTIPTDDDKDKELQLTGSQSLSQGTPSSSGGESRRRRSSTQPSSSDSIYDESAHFSQSENPVVVANARTIEKVDLSSLRKLRNLSKQQFAETQEKLMTQISALSSELESVQPNMHASERYEGVVDKLKECNNDLEKAKDTSKTVSTRFEDVKRLRQRRFQECFDHVSESLSVIYKDLTRSSRHPLGGNAYLTLDNNDEPYMGGIRYTAMPPMKRFRDMDQLSGGEKTMAALALLFAIHSYRQAPFFVLDEVDAALDNVNVKKICNYIRQRSKEFQCIVISLKDMFFEHADSLIGICRDVESLSSKVLTLDLKQFNDNDEVSDDEADNVSVTSRASSQGSRVGRDSLQAFGQSPAKRKSSTPSSSPAIRSRRAEA